jgi:hypothetical protein
MDDTQKPPQETTEEKPEEQTENLEQEFVDELEDMDIDHLVPSMNVNQRPEEEIDPIVGDEELLGLYGEILENCRKDRDNVDEILMNFVDMVMNEGDASSASKEAVVNLLKIKTDTSDKMAKVADLMTRIKLKEKDTFPRYLAAQQNNKVVIEGSKREMIKSIQKMTNRKKLGSE